MGKRYEKSRKNVAENRQTRERLREDKELLRREFDPLSDLRGLQSLLDDEVAGAVDEVAAVEQTETVRIEGETAEARNERERIEKEIRQEIDKLNAGLEKLQAAMGASFGEKSRDRAAREYKKELDKFAALFFELDSTGAGDLPANQQYVRDTINALDNGLQESFDRETVIAGAQDRKMNLPSTSTKNGDPKGVWKDDIYFFDDHYVPEKHNPDGKNMAQIRQELSERYSITFEGIPYHNSVADFSCVSVANIPTDEIARRASGLSDLEYDCMTPMERTDLFQTVFSSTADGKGKRERNFDIADHIAAERQIPIPGLPEGYSATQLQQWRSDNRFSWDEQLHDGYNLVPAVIHGNLSHTGLVSTSGKAGPAINRVRNALENNPALYSWKEEDAPISISDLFDI